MQPQSSFLVAGLLAACQTIPVSAHPQHHGASEQNIVVDASRVTGRLKNLQGKIQSGHTDAWETCTLTDRISGTNNAETEYTPSDFNDFIHDLNPAIGQLYPEYGIKHVLICKTHSSPRPNPVHGQC